MKKVAILQSNYLPWKGYFDLINAVDEFIFYDSAQYTKNDWRNRNRIKTPNGLLWLTIPVQVKHRDQKISETLVAQNNWNIKHYKTIKQYYSGARYFKEYQDVLEDLYLGYHQTGLSEINYHFIQGINKLLDIETRLSWSSEYELAEGKTERLVHLCEQAGAGIYLSGPSARDYLDESLFAEKDISVEWMDYSGYPEYRQLHPPFEHGVSIIDLILNEGPESRKFMKSV